MKEYVKQYENTSNMGKYVYRISRQKFAMYKK